MPKVLYNEGRVVGLSAYEEYVRRFLSQDPDGEPASERDWLAASLASGASLILKVAQDADPGLHVVDINLPANTNLRAANTIVANWTNLHVGAAGNLITKVTSYSDDLIPNKAGTGNHPNSGHQVPGSLPHANSPVGLTSADKVAIRNYFRIKDGVVLQDGSWKSNTTGKPPEMQFEPDLSQPPIVRLLIDGAVTSDFYILLTGFIDAGVLQGVIGTDVSPNVGSGIARPENGDFLGPATFPWANKIIFGLSSTYVDQIVKISDPSEIGADTDAEYVTISNIDTSVDVIKIPRDNDAVRSFSDVKDPNQAISDTNGYLNWNQLFRILAYKDSKKCIDTLTAKIRSLSAALDGATNGTVYNITKNGDVITLKKDLISTAVENASAGTYNINITRSGSSNIVELSEDILGPQILSLKNTGPNDTYVIKRDGNSISLVKETGPDSVDLNAYYIEALPIYDAPGGSAAYSDYYWDCRLTILKYAYKSGGVTKDMQYIGAIGIFENGSSQTIGATQHWGQVLAIPRSYNSTINTLFTNLYGAGYDSNKVIKIEIVPRPGYNDYHGTPTYNSSYGAPTPLKNPNEMTAYIVQKATNNYAGGASTAQKYDYSLIIYFANNSRVIYLTDAVYMCSISKQGDMVGSDFVVNRGGFIWTPPA